MHRSKQKPGLISQNQPQVWNINLYTAYISVWTLKDSFGNIMDMFLRHYWLHAHASELYWPKQKFQSFIPIHLLKMNEKEDIQNLISIWMISFTVNSHLHIHVHACYMMVPSVLKQTWRRQTLRVAGTSWLQGRILDKSPVYLRDTVLYETNLRICDIMHPESLSLQQKLLLVQSPTTHTLTFAVVLFHPGQNWVFREDIVPRYTSRTRIYFCYFLIANNKQGKT